MLARLLSAGRSKLYTPSIVTVALVLVASIESSAIAAALPIAGWGYSVGNIIYRVALDDPDNPWNVRGWGWIVDPPAELIISGRLTLNFDPSMKVGGVGWLGEFGSNPLNPAPPIGAEFALVDQLQPSCSTLMVSCSVSVDQSIGQVVFEFDWGTPGFLPTLYLSERGHFNFAGIWFEDRTTPADYSAPLGLQGSAAEVVRLGTSARTYMLCTSGYCGVFVPEPGTWAMFVSGFGVLGIAIRRRRILKAATF